MRQYYCFLRLYRQQDQDYWSFKLHTAAESLGGLENQLKSFEMGLRVAGAGKLYLENVFIDVRPGDYLFQTVEDPNLHLELQYFLGLKRDRRHKAPPKTEATWEQDLETEKEHGPDDSNSDA